MSKTNIVMDFRRCGCCHRETNDMRRSLCPDCGGFMYPIGYGYAPKIHAEKLRKK